MSAAEFSSWVRFFLAIPQLTRLGNATKSVVLGYEAEQCMHRHLKNDDHLLDVHATHANSGCPSASAGLHKRHSMFKWAVYYAAQEAGCMAQMEPKTENLLLGQFSADECRALFPKAPGKRSQEVIDRIMAERDDILTMLPGPDRDKKLKDISSTCRLLNRQHKTKGVRIDVAITAPDTNDALFVDTTCIHTSCKSRRGAELDVMQGIQKANADMEKGNRL
jgi:hypothetical protein